MKYVILLGDGMADYPTEKLGGKTPLECAFTPFIDQIAADNGIIVVIAENSRIRVKNSIIFRHAALAIGDIYAGVHAFSPDLAHHVA